MEAEIFNKSCWVFDIDETDLIQLLNKLLSVSGFEVLASCSHKFTPFGYTEIWLLGESHLALHTFPEKSVTYIELSSCVKNKLLMFWEYFQDWAFTNNKVIKITNEQRYVPF